MELDFYYLFSPIELIYVYLILKLALIEIHDLLFFFYLILQGMHKNKNAEKIKQMLYFYRFLSRYECNISATPKVQLLSYERWIHVVLQCRELTPDSDNRISSVICDSCRDPVTCNLLPNVTAKPVTRQMKFTDVHGNESRVAIPVACVCVPNAGTANASCTTE